MPPTERLGLMTPSETDAYVAELKAERDALRERETLTLNQVGKLIGEVDALREALERAKEQLEKFGAKGPKQVGRALLTIDAALEGPESLKAIARSEG